MGINNQIKKINNRNKVIYIKSQLRTSLYKAHSNKLTSYKSSYNSYNSNS